jgi:hypothetical protein
MSIKANQRYEDPIPEYDGSMLSVRSPSGKNNGVRYKSAEAEKR